MVEGEMEEGMEEVGGEEMEEEVVVEEMEVVVVEEEMGEVVVEEVEEAVGEDGSGSGSGDK